MKKYIVLLACFGSCFCDGIGLRVGNPDDTAKIERPCITYDQNCIRNYFSKHAQCKKTYGPAPEPLFRPQSNLYLPRVNLSITQTMEYITGINGRIVEFFINRDTDRLLITIEFQNLRIESNNTFFRFHRRAKEPVVTSAFAGVLYDSLEITTIIPKLNDLQLDKAEAVTFSNTFLPPTVAGPGILESTDPQVAVTGVEFFSNLELNIQELFLTDSFYFAVSFIQYNLCDFGLTVT